jgi:hypothetical protein
VPLIIIWSSENVPAESGTRNNKLRSGKISFQVALNLLPEKINFLEIFSLTPLEDANLLFA